jgi:hypothetical protein
MGKRKVSILSNASEELAHIAYFIESKGLPDTAKKFVSDAFEFFETLSDNRLNHQLCKYQYWRMNDYKCKNYKRKFVVAFIEAETEIIICDFAIQKLLKTI